MSEVAVLIFDGKIIDFLRMVIPGDEGSAAFDVSSVDMDDLKRNYTITKRRFKETDVFEISIWNVGKNEKGFHLERFIFQCSASSLRHANLIGFEARYLLTEVSGSSLSEVFDVSTLVDDGMSQKCGKDRAVGLFKSRMEAAELSFSEGCEHGRKR